MKTQHISLPGLGAHSARLAAVFIIGSLFTVSAAQASERWETLQAIHMLENPGDSHAPGNLGELGAYQFREETWKMHTQAPFSRALDRRSSDAVAVKHYDWIKDELEKRGVVVTPYTVALAWNGGIKAAVAGHPPASAVDYASRAANLAAEFRRGRLADAR
jgi:hypothetical protein